MRTAPAVRGASARAHSRPVRRRPYRVRRRGAVSRCRRSVRAIVVAGLDDRALTLRSCLESAAAACERGEWTSAVAIAQAAAAFAPQDPAVVDMLARASGG